MDALCTCGYFLYDGNHLTAALPTTAGIYQVHQKPPSWEHPCHILVENELSSPMWHSKYREKLLYGICLQLL